MANFTNEARTRLRELEALDADGVRLSADDYAELRDLLNREDANFVSENLLGKGTDHENRELDCCIQEYW